MDKQSADILRRAKALIDRPEKWHRGSTAYGPDDSKCIGCALSHAHHEVFEKYSWNHPAYVLYEKVIGQNLIIFNMDKTTTHADVMAAFDRAIALAEGRISDEAYTARFISEVVKSVESQEVRV